MRERVLTPLLTEFPWRESTDVAEQEMWRNKKCPVNVSGISPNLR
jgi:hypothetical protein